MTAVSLNVDEVSKARPVEGGGRPVVLQLIDSFNEGGSERQALQLTRLLSQSTNFEVRLASLSSEGSLRHEISGFELGEVPSFPLTSFYDANAMLQLKRLVRFLKSAQVKVLHTHDFYTNIFGMAAGKLARVPVRVASMRETFGMRTQAQQRGQRIAYALSHQVITNSGAVRDEALRQGLSAEKVTIIHNGLDLERMTRATGQSLAESSALLGLPQDSVEDKKFVTIVANMRHDVKDYPMFLRAARKVRESVPNAAFLLAGEGELMEQLRELARELDIADCTFFLGRCAHVPELLSISDVCVLSSRAEGFSNAILEYMAAGRPVVATDVGGAREAISEGQTGYLVASGDDAAMADRIILLLRDPELMRTMGQRARRTVEDNFSCEAQLRKTEALYDRLLRENSSAKYLRTETQRSEIA